MQHACVRAPASRIVMRACVGKCDCVQVRAFLCVACRDGGGRKGDCGKCVCVCTTPVAFD